MNKLAVFAGIVLATALPAPVLAIDAHTGFSKRTAIFAFASRCALLGPSELSAVQSGQLQTRGVLLRSGTSSAEVAQMQAIAETSAEEIDCTNAEALTEIDLVRSSHASWQVLHALDYPATHRSWTTRRDVALLERRWRVVQDLEISEDSQIRFGATSLDGRASLDLLIENQAPPKSVLLRLRDPNKLENPLPTLVRKILKLPTEGVAGLAPPNSGAETFFAAHRVPAEASLLSDTKNVRGVRFGFGAEVLKAFSQLDPREAVVVDLYWSAGLGKPDLHKRLYVEVGDFLAARLFAEAKD